MQLNHFIECILDLNQNKYFVNGVDFIYIEVRFYYLS